LNSQIAEELAKSIKQSKARVVDLCCGVGISTRALQRAFPDAEAVIGVDTSPEMISMANFLSDQQCRMQPIADFFKKNFAGINKSFNTQGIAVKRVYVKARRAITEYTCENAENTALPDKSFDLVTVM
jgi:ubiquinone/menaquinone biosynthesis C-methylase UbiE